MQFQAKSDASTAAAMQKALQDEVEQARAEVCLYHPRANGLIA